MAEEPITTRRGYLSFLLRLWQAGAAPGGWPASPPWRASLEWPRNGRRQAFTSLEDLFAFLEEETRSGGQGSRAHGEEGDDEGMGAGCAPDSQIR